jgi:hypothetical protein
LGFLKVPEMPEIPIIEAHLNDDISSIEDVNPHVKNAK